MGFRLANVDGRAALVDGDSWWDLATVTGRPELADPMAAIADVGSLHSANAGIRAQTPSGSMSQANLGAPVPRPRNSFAVGLNYGSHVAEAQMDVPDVPLIFTKFSSCIVGPDAEVELRTETGDYEAELVVVIGSTARDVSADDAWSHIAGLTVGQDLSDRGLQFAAKPPHFDLGKSRDGYGPTGPVLVSPDLVPDANSLAISCEVNGEVRQSDTTASMIFDVATLVEYLSGIVTLEPGDLIFTGTPDGVGMVSGKFLAAGDVLTTTIEGIGTITQRFV